MWLDYFRRRRYERELDDELRFDLECRTEDNIRRGMSRAEARRQAVIALGGMEQTKEDCRTAHPSAWLESVLQDLRYGFRALRRSPGFTAVAVLSLAAGIGANSAVFSLIDGVWTRPMPVPRSSEIVRLVATGPEGEQRIAGADYMDLRAARTLTGLAAIDYRGPLITIKGARESTYAEVVSDNFFTLLGVEAEIGRPFDGGQADLSTRDRPGSPRAEGIVLGHRFFEKKFGGDKSVIGRTVGFRGRAVTVLGVAPASFRGTRTGMSADLWIPFSVWDEPGELADRRIPSLAVIGRLRPGASAEQAQQELSGIAVNLARAYPDTNKHRGVKLETDRSRRLRNAGRFGLMMLALVGSVLLLASANVALLLLARAETRRREIAVRLTLGAGRLRLVRQLLTESSLLAACGAVCGIAFGSILIRLAPAFLHLYRFLPQAEFALDTRVLLFSLAVAAGAGLLSGVIPALLTARTDLTPALKGAAAAAGGSGGRTVARNALVCGQMAVSLVLVTASILLALSFLNSLNADLGFARKNVLVLEIPHLKNAGTGPHELLYRQVVEKVRSLPGVHAAAVAMRPPLGGSGGGRTERVLLPGTTRESRDIGVTIVGPGYFALLGTRLLRGREFDDRDGYAAAKVAIINETGAKRLWPSDDPIGKLLQTGDANGPRWEIAGVAKDARVNSITESPAPYLYFPFAQMNSGDVTLLVETGTSPTAFQASIRERLKEVDSQLAIDAAYTMDDLIGDALFGTRIAWQLAAVLGLAGVLLAAIGLYGVVSYLVNARARETGVRIALGARPADVIRGVLRHGGRLAAWGIGAGVVVGIAGSRALASVLYGVNARNPAALLGAAALMLAVALAASWLPARRAARVDPALTLKQE